MTESILPVSIAAAFILSGSMVWLFLKSKQAKSQAELEAKSAYSEQLLKTTQEQHKESLTTISSLQEEFSQLKSTNASLTTQVANLEGVIGKQEERVCQLENNLNSAQKDLISANENKAKAEAGLNAAYRGIDELQQKERELREELSASQKSLSLSKEGNAELQAKYDESVKRLKEQQTFIDDAHLTLKEAFGSLSADALRKNNESFVELAKAKLDEKVAETKGEMEKKEQAIDSLIRPLSESLSKFDNKIQEIEKVRLEQHGQVNQYILGIQQSTDKLQKETHNLVSALKTSYVRGKYGEIALRRVVEFAGMTEHCDFQEQASVQTEDGLLRPDMNIMLPESKTIVVDSKTPLAAYMRAFETEDEEERRACLIQHSLAVKDHLKKLSAKAYWSQFPQSPDYVILYMQIESSFGAALQIDPNLIEEGIRNNIVFATPTTLITLLRTVGFVWQQRSVADNIESIRDAGIELYNRTTVLLKHFGNMGSSLRSAVTHYNGAISSLESRFIPQATKLYTLGSAYTKHVLPETTQIEITPKLLEVEKEITQGLTEEEKITAVLKPEQ
jgi:DNA recombination protein RmuC